MAEPKKTIRIKYVGFWPNFDQKSFFMTKILQKMYNIEFCDNPDFVICSCLSEYPEYLEYPQPRLLFSGENYLPDLNLVDYAISGYPISLYDRCFRVPYGTFHLDKSHYCAKRTKGEVKFCQEDLKRKTRFASFCVSHDSEHNIRGDFFKRLNEYKFVDSIGTYLNNTGAKVSFSDGTKLAYQRTCKFSLCFESTSHAGFNTEKILDAFASDTIPVYYGDPYIGEIYNKKAFINVADYDSVDDAIARIIELDNDDNAYLEMLNQPVYNDPAYLDTLLKGCEAFLKHIFDQSPEVAYRRSRVYAAKNAEMYMRNAGYVYRRYRKLDAIFTRKSK